MRMMKVKLKLTHLKNMMRSLCSFMRIVVNFFSPLNSLHNFM